MFYRKSWLVRNEMVVFEDSAISHVSKYIFCLTIHSALVAGAFVFAKLVKLQRRAPIKHPEMPDGALRDAFCM